MSRASRGRRSLGRARRVACRRRESAAARVVPRNSSRQTSSWRPIAAVPGLDPPGGGRTGPGRRKTAPTTMVPPRGSAHSGESTCAPAPAGPAHRSTPLSGRFRAAVPWLWERSSYGQAPSALLREGPTLARRRWDATTRSDEMSFAERRALPPTPDAGTPRGGPGPASDDPGWLVTFTGSAPDHEPSRAAQTALAGGVIGTAGSAPLRLPGSRCEVIVGNVYLGTGAATDLLRAPTWTLLEGEPATDPALVRIVDLRSGTLHQEIQTAAGPLQVTAFSSLAHPGVVGLRAWGPGARPPESGPLDMQAVPEPPSLPARPVDVGDGISLLRVAARPGGVAIAARDRVWVGSDGMPGLDRLGVYVASPRRPDGGPGGCPGPAAERREAVARRSTRRAAAWGWTSSW